MNKNEKILCEHCETHIGTKHAESNHGYQEYKQFYTIVPTKMGVITKIKIKGTSSTYPYGNMETESGYFQQTQFCCTKCSKHTTVITQNSN